MRFSETSQQRRSSGWGDISKDVERLLFEITALGRSERTVSETIQTSSRESTSSHRLTDRIKRLGVHACPSSVLSSPMVLGLFNMTLTAEERKHSHQGRSYRPPSLPREKKRTVLTGSGNMTVSRA